MTRQMSLIVRQVVFDELVQAQGKAKSFNLCGLQQMKIEQYIKNHYSVVVLRYMAQRVGWLSQPPSIREGGCKTVSRNNDLIGPWRRLTIIVVTLA
jgi:hypothetical protein